ncbi:unnamed protein product [Meloidogyne enterolobii]|uniref:Uncharacterized protein n=1 Tax=Meloidogyne enterolobii TaxID=390850 RepID=A0ACB0YU16_MELEN
MMFFSDLSIQCKVSVDWYDAIDNLKFTYRNMLEEELFSDCVIKVYLKFKNSQTMV